MQTTPERAFNENNSLHCFPGVCVLLFVWDQNAYVMMHKDLFKPRVL